jgi:methionine aminopeptidase
MASYENENDNFIDSEEIEVPELTPDIITKYNDATKIARKVYDRIVKQIISGVFDTKSLCDYGNNMILDEVKQVYKKEKNKGIGFPVSISLNNCVGNFVHEDNPSFSEFNTIKSGDIVKLLVGVHISGYLSWIGDTFIFKNNQILSNEKIDFLRNLKQKVVKFIQPGMETDEVKQFIESECTDLSVFPLENTTISEQFKNNPVKFDGKNFILNYRPYYDESGDVVGDENVNYELLENEVYNFDITVTQDLNQDEVTKFKVSKDTEHVLVKPHDPHIYRCNEFSYSLKLKNSRMFYNHVKSLYQLYPFDFTELKKSAVNKMGLKECLDNNIIDTFDVSYTKDKHPVYHIKFTVLLKNNKTICY